MGRSLHDFILIMCQTTICTETLQRAPSWEGAEQRQHEQRQQHARKKAPLATAAKPPTPLKPPKSPPHHLAPLVIPATPPSTGDPLSGLEDSMRKPIMRKRRGSAPAILSPIFTSSNTSVSLPALKNPPTTTTSTTKKKTKREKTLDDV